MKNGTCIRLSDGFTEIWRNGQLIAEVHPTDMRSMSSSNAINDIARWAIDGTLPAKMRPRVTSICPQVSEDSANGRNSPA